MTRPQSAWRRASAGNAFTMTEILISVAALALVGVSAFDLISGGVRGATQATGFQTATLLVSKAVDDVLAIGYRRLLSTLKPGNGSEAMEFNMNLAALGEQSEARSAEDEILISGGCSYRGKVLLDKVHPGLIRVTFNLSWQRCGTPDGRDPIGTLSATRYVGAPILGVAR